MAEVLGIVSSLVGIIQLAGQLAILTQGYIGGVKRASQDITGLLNELESFGKVLCALKDYIETKPESAALLELDGPDGPLRGCARELEMLQAKLIPREGLKGMFDSLKWPLKEAETQGYILQFERHKSLFTLALSVDHITLSKEIAAYGQTTMLLVQDIWAESADQKAWRQGYSVAEAKVTRDKVLGWLSPKDFEKNSDKHLETNKLRHQGTGEWLLVTPEFLDLSKKSPGGSLLWGFGIPGAGKTFLSSAAINHFDEEATAKNYGVAYTYFEYKERGRQTPVNILASLVTQLASQIPELPAEIEKLHSKLESRGKKPMFDELYNALVATFKSFDQIFLIFDALDECDPKSQRRELLPLFHRMRKSGARLFVTSRQYPEDIQESFHDSAKIELIPKKEDIRIHIQQRIDGDGRARRLIQQAKCQDRIISELVDSSQGMFLLAHLNIEYICQQPTARKVLTAVDRIKNSSIAERPLDPTYDRAMEILRGQSEDCVDLGLLVLTWLVKANRTLTVEEIRIAVAIEADRYELEDLDLPDKATILDVCAGLVTINETSNTMRLVHYTVQEYLLAGPMMLKDSSANFKLATACATFLTFDIFTEGACASDSSLRSRLKQQPFLRYATHQLPHHLKACDEDLTTDIVLRFLEKPGNIASCLQVSYYDDDGSNDEEDVNYKNYGASSGCYTDDSEDEEDEEDEEDFDRYPKEHTSLHMAATLGHLTAFKLLLNQADTSLAAINSHGETVLHVAATEGHERVVELLLENGVDPSTLDKSGETALHGAAWNGQTAVVRLLLEKKVDLSVQEVTGQTPLFQAAMAGNSEVVQLLLRHGADFSTTDEDGETPLHIAAFGGHKEVVRLLLEHGADPSALDLDGETALHEACWHGDEALVKLLLEKGAHVSILDKYGRSALLQAALAGHSEVVRLLLGNGADWSVPNQDGETPLHVAAYHGRRESAELLLENGADVNALDTSGRSVLFCAVISGHGEVVRMLLGNGADYSIPDENGETPLHIAAYHGRRESAELLLENGANVHVLDNYGMTALFKAAQTGHLAEVQLLLDKGADLSVPGGNGETPLDAAVRVGHEAVAQLLRDNGACVSVKATDGETARENAASEGHSQPAVVSTE